MIIYRSSHRRCSVRKSVLRNFAKVTGIYLCQELYFNKVRHAALLKQRLQHRCFPLNFAKFLRTPFLHNTSGRLFLNKRRCFMHLTRRVRSLLEHIFVKFQVFALKSTENYYRGTAPYITLKIQMFKQSHFSQFLSGWLLLKIPQQTKTCSKLRTLELLQLGVF